MRRIVLPMVVVLAALVAGPASAENTGFIPQRAHVSALTQSLGVEVGQLSIPAIGVDEIIREGVDLSVIDRGVGHWAGTAGPGSIGNMVLAGHRTTKTHPFLDLDQLVPGDTVFVTGLDGRTATYEVTETVVVSPSDLWIVEQTGDAILTMFACHPKGSARERLVVRAELTDVPVVQFP